MATTTKVAKAAARTNRYNELRKMLQERRREPIQPRALVAQQAARILARGRHDPADLAIDLAVRALADRRLEAGRQSAFSFHTTVRR